MRLTTMSDYAMRLLMYVGQHPERLCTISEVARAYDISEAHLMKITHQGAILWQKQYTSAAGGTTTALNAIETLELAKPWLPDWERQAARRTAKGAKAIGRSLRLVKAAGATLRLSLSNRSITVSSIALPGHPSDFAWRPRAVGGSAISYKLRRWSAAAFRNSEERTLRAS